MKLVTREQWDALPAKGGLSDWLEHGGVVIHHAADATNPPDHDTCYERVRAYQRAHLANLEQDWIDIAYSFLACPHGFVFEGRGWGGRSGANGTTEDNATDLAVCLIGNGALPIAAPAVEAFREVIAGWMGLGGHNTLRPHSAIKQTACPGDRLRALVNDGTLGHLPVANPVRDWYVWLEGRTGRKRVVDVVRRGDNRGYELAATARRTVTLANKAHAEHRNGPEFRLVERRTKPVVGKRL